MTGETLNPLPYHSTLPFTPSPTLTPTEPLPRELIGHPTPGGVRYCCTKELVPKTKCFQDRLIYQVHIPGVPMQRRDWQR